MAKKTPTMLKRLKKWKGIKKEDIEKYGTPEEIKLLEGFEEEHGIEEAGEVEEVEEVGEATESQPSDDMLAALIAGADDEILTVMMALIQEELESRGTQADVTVMGGEEEEAPEHEAEELPVEEEMEDETL